MSRSRTAAATCAELVNEATGTSAGLNCPFDGTRLTAAYSTEITVRVRCTYGSLRGGTAHEFSLPVAVVEAYFRSRGYSFPGLT